MADRNGNVTFIRVNGRIVPIRKNREKSNLAGNTAAIGTIGAGTLLAGDAARTRRVFERGGVTIDTKRVLFQPFVKKTGHKLIMRDAEGKALGQAMWYVRGQDKIGKEASFSWLGVKSHARGQGHSKTLSRVAVHQMKKEGVKSLWNHVVHEGSVKTNNTKADTFWKAGKEKGIGREYTKVTVKQAESNIRWHRKTKGLMTSDIYRATDLRKTKTVFPGIRKAYMTGGMKKKLALGVGMAVLGAGTLLYNGFQSSRGE